MDGDTDPKAVVLSSGDIRAANAAGGGLTVARDGSDYVITNTAPVFSAAEDGDAALVVATGEAGAGGIRGVRSAGGLLSVDGTSHPTSIILEVPESGVAAVVRSLTRQTIALRPSDVTYTTHSLPSRHSRFRWMGSMKIVGGNPDHGAAKRHRADEAHAGIVAGRPRVHAHGPLRGRSVRSPHGRNGNLRVGPTR